MDPLNAKNDSQAIPDISALTNSTSAENISLSPEPKRETDEMDAPKEPVSSEEAIPTRFVISSSADLDKIIKTADAPANLPVGEEVVLEPIKIPAEKITGEIRPETSVQPTVGIKIPADIPYRQKTEINPRNAVIPEKPDVPVRAPLIPENKIMGGPRTPSIVTPEEKIPEKNTVRAMRTYQSDVAESVRTNKTSLVKMVISEEERRRNLADITSPKSRRNLSMIILSFILVVGGVSAAYFVYNRINTGQTKNNTVKTKSIIFSEQEKLIPVTGKSAESIAKTIGGEIRARNGRLDTIENISLTETVGGIEVPLTTERLFFFLDNRAPPSLVRSFLPSFMLGVHTYNGNQAFLIFRTDYYENAFAGMLGWEDHMARDLLPVFGEGVAGSDPVLNKPFEDRTIKNRDVRILTDENGNTLFFYTFLDKKTVLITTSSDAMEEVIRRLNSSGSVIR